MRRLHPHRIAGLASLLLGLLACIPFSQPPPPKENLAMNPFS
jgi:hypothetical protein